MAVKLGTTDIVFRSGSGTPAKVFKGSTPIQTTPGAPTINSASDILGESTIFNINPPSNDGGSPVTAYKFYVDEVYQVTYQLGGIVVPVFPGSFVGQELKASAVNAIGEGPLSSGVTVT